MRRTGGLFFYFKRVSILKTLYMNFRYFKPSTAIKFPILVSKNCKLLCIKGKVIVNGKVSFGMIKIGFGHVGIFDQESSKSIWEVNGKVTFHGKACIGHGSKISVGGELIIGDNFIISAESSIVCHNKISIGNNCLFSWDVLIMDTDFHKIKNLQNQQINKNAPIFIGNNVWIGCRCLLLKGSSVPDGTVVAANTMLTKEIIGENQIIGGNPVRIMKENIKWSF